MQGRNLILVAIAVVLGLFAVIAANAWFSGVEQKQQQSVRKLDVTPVVVAAADLPFGTLLTQQNLRLASFPADTIPQGAFTTIAAALKGGAATLRPIVVGEPVLASKLSSRATLSANLPVGMVAVAVPVSAAASAGGFIHPGDVVDVLLTRQIPGDGASNTDKMTDVVLSAVPVLAIDTINDDKNITPVIGKTATLQVDTLGAQKLALAQQLGVISLALRNASDQSVALAPTVIPPQLSTRRFQIRGRGTGAAAAPVFAMTGPMAAPPASPPKPIGPLMIIVRGNQSSEYEVIRGR